MPASVVASLVVAGLAVLGAIGSVLLLALRTGMLLGRVETWMQRADQDRIEIWAAIGRQGDRIERWIERQK